MIVKIESLFFITQNFLSFNHAQICATQMLHDKKSNQEVYFIDVVHWANKYYEREIYSVPGTDPGTAQMIQIGIWYLQRNDSQN